MLVLSGKKFQVGAAMLAIAVCCGHGAQLRAADQKVERKSDQKAEEKVDFMAVAQELQKTKKDGDALLLVFWFPQEYFKIAVQDNPRLTADQKAQFTKALSPYTVFAVIDGEVGAFGAITYKAEAEVRTKTRFVDSKGKSREPLVEEDINGEAKTFLAVFKPIMTNMIGPMGANMHVFFFPAKGDDDKALFEVKSKGAVTLKVGTDEFRWRLPLGSLMPAKVCPKCQEKCSGAWDFCPWCGAHLETAAP
jgi:hypothetical protein